MKRFYFFSLIALVAMISFFSSCGDTDELAVPTSVNHHGLHDPDSLYGQYKDVVPVDTLIIPYKPGDSLDFGDFQVIQFSSEEEEIQPRTPLYEIQWQTGGTTFDVCKLVMDDLTYSNNDVVSYDAVVISNNAIDDDAAEAFVAAVQQDLFVRYGRCYEVKLHLAITPRAPSGHNFSWALCIGDISTGSVLENVTVTTVTGDCVSSPFSESLTKNFIEDPSCIGLEHQFVAGCLFEKINHAYVPGFNGLWWVHFTIDWVKTSDGTVYPTDIPLLVNGSFVPNVNEVVAQAFQQPVYSSYGWCFPSRGEISFVESILQIRLRLGDISNQASTVLDSWGCIATGSNGVTYYLKGNIGEHSSPGSFGYYDNVCP